MSKLTMKKAKEIASKVLGTTKGLVKDEWIENRYVLVMGDFQANIVPYEYNGTKQLIKVAMYGSVNTSFGIYDAETLQEEYQEEETLKELEQKEAFEEWLQKFDSPESVQKHVEKYFN